MELVAASELFLRVARLGRLSAARDRSRRWKSVGLRRARRTDLHVLAPGACLRHSAARGAHAGKPRPGEFRAYQRRTNAFFPAPPRTTTVEMHDRAAKTDRHRRRLFLARSAERRRRSIGWSAAPQQQALRHRRAMPTGSSPPRCRPIPDRHERRRPPTRSITNCRRHSSRLVLGPQRKYSCCLYDEGADTLAAAEERRIAGNRRARRRSPTASASSNSAAAGARCRSGWRGAYPAARITAVSNSQFAARLHRQARRRSRALANLEVITADMNAFVPPGRFDRVVSVEMFEHMSNWRPLLRPYARLSRI